jgi:hypothetical protein
MIPPAFQKAEAITLGGTKERSRAWDETIEYMPHLQRENAALRAELEELKGGSGVEMEVVEEEEEEEEATGVIDPALLG